MQELLSKLVEMDERAQKLKEEAEREKAASEQSVDQLRRKIYDDYIERAKDRVAKNFAVDRKMTDDELSAYQNHVESLKEEMNRRYEQEGERWVSEIVERVLA